MMVMLVGDIAIVVDRRETHKLVHCSQTKVVEAIAVQMCIVGPVLLQDISWAPRNGGCLVCTGWTCVCLDLWA